PVIGEASRHAARPDRSIEARRRHARLPCILPPALRVLACAVHGVRKLRVNPHPLVEAFPAHIQFGGHPSEALALLAPFNDALAELRLVLARSCHLLCHSLAGW